MIKRIKTFILRYSNRKTAAAIFAVLSFFGAGLIAVAISDSTDKNITVTEQQVSVAIAGNLAQLNSVFKTTGKVISQTQGDLRAQRSGIITRVYKTVRQKVSAGATIATIENASERASVAQAKANVAKARANLNKIKSGTRKEELAVLSTNTANALQNVKTARNSAKNTLLRVYATTDSVFAGGVDLMFYNADGVNPRLRFVSTESNSVLKAELSRLILQAVISRQETSATRVELFDTNALKNEITISKGELLRIKTFLDNLISALNGAIISTSVSRTTLTNYKTIASQARSNILAMLTSLSSADSAIDGAQNALTIAKENESKGVIGAQKEDIEMAEAQLSSAKAGLSQAFAQFEKTQVKAPVSGVITTLTISKGDFVSAFQDVGLVSNSDVLEVVTFVSPKIANRISNGDSVIIGGKYNGKVTSIALSIDPIKRQVEVHIAITNKNTNLTQGSRTSVKFVDTSPNGRNTNSASPILVPISAIKLIGSDAFIFSVSKENILIAHKVNLGSVIQKMVEIKSGIDKSTVIVLDARGLDLGEKVIVSSI